MRMKIRKRLLSCYDALQSEEMSCWLEKKEDYDAIAHNPQSNLMGSGIAPVADC
jgi:hypothetical protein